MARELFEVTGGEYDLISSHLWWVTNLHLLALSVIVNKTDGDWGVWGTTRAGCAKHECSTEEKEKIKQKHQRCVHTCGYLLKSEQSVVTGDIGV